MQFIPRTGEFDVIGYAGIGTPTVVLSLRRQDVPSAERRDDSSARCDKTAISAVWGITSQSACRRTRKLRVRRALPETRTGKRGSSSVSFNSEFSDDWPRPWPRLEQGQTATNARSFREVRPSQGKPSARTETRCRAHCREWNCVAGSSAIRHPANRRESELGPFAVRVR